MAMLHIAAVAAFLCFNLRLPRRGHARVFLGDAGSTLLGFALAWFAIDLTQGPGRSFPPICALWIVLLPLADCVSLMTRRIAAGRSPFSADRLHIHDYLRARGLSSHQTLGVLAGTSAAFGAIGFLGWRLGAPQHVLFWAFFFLFFAYHFGILKAWKSLEGRRTTHVPKGSNGCDAPTDQPLSPR
jgi:UDP-GlcNAc:undecaprenyl-phosphate GlcNAc-1-phosphate transferase